MSPEQPNIESGEEHSLATEAEEQAHLEDVKPKVAEGDDSENESIDTQLANAQETIKDYWEQMMRLRAEIDNNRKRAERDLADVPLAHARPVGCDDDELVVVVVRADDSGEMVIRYSVSDLVPTFTIVRCAEQVRLEIVTLVSGGGEVKPAGLERMGFDRIDLDFIRHATWRDIGPGPAAVSRDVQQAVV